MSEDRVKLTATQLNFLMDMLEINDPKRAAKKFVDILLEEKLPPKNISTIINKIMNKMKKK